MFCATSSATGSGRSAAGCHRAWLDGGVRPQASLPMAFRSATLGWAILSTATWRTSCSNPVQLRHRPIDRAGYARVASGFSATAVFGLGSAVLVDLLLGDAASAGQRL